MPRYYIPIHYTKTRGARYNGAGKRLGGGAIHAFESYWDAVRWAAKMDWDHNHATGTGDVTILTLERTGEWDTDHNDTLTQASCEGAWLKAFRSIPAAEIIDAAPITTELVRAAISRFCTGIKTKESN